MAMQDRLRWQQLTAPDFRPAANLQQTSVDAMNKAFEAAGKTLTDLENSRQQGMDSSAYAQSLQFRDPLKREEAYADGSIYGGFDPAKLSLSNLQRMQADDATMLRGADDRNTFSNTIAKQEDLAANADLINRLNTLSANGDHAGMVKGLAELQGKVRPQTYASLVQDFQSRMTTGQTTLAGQYNHNQTLQNAEDDKLVNAYLANVGPSLVNNQGLQSAYSQAVAMVNAGQMDPRLLPKIRQGLDAMYALSAGQAGGVLDPTTKQLLSAAVPPSVNPGMTPASWTAELSDADIVGNIGSILGMETKGGADAGAVNAGTGATGLGQFLGSTWVEKLPKYFPQIAAGKTKDQMLALRTDPDLSRAMTAAYAQENAQILRDEGIPVTSEALYAMHHLGPGAGPRFLKAAPNTPLTQILSGDALAKNPYMMDPRQGGGTVGGLRQNWASKHSNNVPGTVSREQARTTAATNDAVNLGNNQEFAVNSDMVNVVKASSAEELAKTPRQVASELVGESGIFSGYPVEAMEGLLKRVMQMRPEGMSGNRVMKASQAAALLAEHGSLRLDEVGWLGKLGGFVSDKLDKPGIHFDGEDAVRQAAGRFFTTEGDFAQMAVQQAARNMQGSAEAQAAAEAERANIRAAYQQVAAMPNGPQKNQLLADLAMRDQALQASASSQAGYDVNRLRTASGQAFQPEAPAQSAAARPAPVPVTLLDGSAGQAVPNLAAPAPAAAPNPQVGLPPAVQQKARTLIQQASGFGETTYAATLERQMRAAANPRLSAQERANLLNVAQETISKMEALQSDRLAKRATADAREAAQARGRQEREAANAPKVEAWLRRRNGEQVPPSPAGTGVLAPAQSAAPMPWDRYLGSPR